MILKFGFPANCRSEVKIPAHRGVFDGEILTFKKGIDLGRRPDLTGGGLIRSAGDWSA